MTSEPIKCGNHNHGYKWGWGLMVVMVVVGNKQVICGWGWTTGVAFVSS